MVDTHRSYCHAGQLPLSLTFCSTHSRDSIQLHAPFVWICALSELILMVTEQHVLPIPASAGRSIQQTLCHTQDVTSFPAVFLTPAAVLGASLTVFGSLLRMVCFRTLGPLFTFDLTILPKHHLVTTGPYAFVRHPAYTGSLCMVIGLALVHLTSGSWLTECGILGRGMTGVGVRLIFASLWMTWWLAVGWFRCRAEDAELRKIFGSHWEEYASRVQAWYIPGVV